LGGDRNLLGLEGLGVGQKRSQGGRRNLGPDDGAKGGPRGHGFRENLHEFNPQGGQRPWGGLGIPKAKDPEIKLGGEPEELGKWPRKRRVGTGLVPLYRDLEGGEHSSCRGMPAGWGSKKAGKSPFRLQCKMKGGLGNSVLGSRSRRNLKRGKGGGFFLDTLPHYEGSVTGEGLGGPWWEETRVDVEPESEWKN